MSLIASTHSPDCPNHKGEEVHTCTKEFGPKCERKENVSEIVDWMVVICSECSGHYKLVMHFVELVETLVCNSMEDIEGGCFYSHADEQLRHHREVRRYLRREADLGVNTVQIEHHRGDNADIEQVD